MVLKKTEAEKKEARKAWDRRYYEKKRAVKPTTAKLEVAYDLLQSRSQSPLDEHMVCRVKVRCLY
jgi:hypothetical protein